MSEVDDIIDKLGKVANRAMAYAAAVGALTGLLTFLLLVMLVALAERGA